MTIIAFVRLLRAFAPSRETFRARAAALAMAAISSYLQGKA
jgi:hypothetical protein